MNKTRALARNLVKISYEDLPARVVEVTKTCILDTIAVMLAATTQGEGCREVIALAQEGGGKEESSIIAFGDRVPSWMAAFANGGLTHALDYDELHDRGHVHATASSLPAALAIAERLGNASGKDLITAVALANDLVCRLGLCATRDQAEYGWLTPPLLGYFGAAAAAGKLLKLNEDQMVSALAFAFHQATGSFEMASGNSAFRAIYQAFSGKAGVLAALMAEKNLAGGEEVLEGKYGLFNLHFRGEYDPAPLTDGLGEQFEGVNVSLKPWPSCGGTSPFIDAVIALLQEHHFKPEDITEVTLVVNLFGKAGCEPLAGRRAPKKATEAKYSVPFCVAHALVHQKVDIATFSKEGLEDPAVLSMAQKINYTLELTISGKKLLPGTIVIRTADGKTYMRRVDAIYGSPERPMSENDRIAKVRDCIAYSVAPMSRDRVDELIKVVGGLGSLGSVSRLMQLLTPAAK